MENRIKEFKTRLSSLLKEYDVEITSEDVYPGYPECGSDIQINICFNGYYDKSGVYQFGREESVGNFIDHETILK